MEQLVEMAGLIAMEVDNGARILEVEFLVRAENVDPHVDDFHVHINVPNTGDATADINEARARLHQLSLALVEHLRP